LSKLKKLKKLVLVFILILPSLFYIPSQAQEVISCNQYQVNGGDEAFLMNLNTPLKWGNTIYDGNIYTSPKGTVTFGQGDFTYWTYPYTPSISIAAYDYHAFANNNFWGTGNDLYVRYGSGTTYVCIDWKVMLWGQSSGEPVYIRMIAYVDPETYEWEPFYQVSNNAPSDARYGARYEPGGEVFPLNVQFVSEAPNPEPTEIPSPEPEVTPEPEPTSTPEPEESELPEPEISPEPDTEEPSPTEDPEVSPEPSEHPLQPASPQPTSPGPDQDRPQPSQSPDLVIEESQPKQEKQEQKEEIEWLPEEPSTEITPIVTEELIIPEEVEFINEEILSADVVEALAIFENPSDFLDALFNDPQKLIKALKNLGADMSPEVRETAQKIVLVTVIVSQIIVAVAIRRV
jgi:hypothetical protein